MEFDAEERQYNLMMVPDARRLLTNHNIIITVATIDCYATVNGVSRQRLRIISRKTLYAFTRTNHTVAR